MRAWLRWHRRIGLASALCIVVLAVTGLLLNHATQWGWDRKPLRGDFWWYIYGMEKPALHAYAMGDHWITQIADKYLFFNREELADCHGKLLPPVEMASGWGIACESHLILIDSNGELVEQIDQRLGLPTPVTGIAHDEQGLLIRSSAGVYRVNLERLVWQLESLDAQLLFNDSVAQRPPEDLQAALESYYAGNSLNLERLLFDMHTGRVFGPGGIWIVDALAVLFVVLALSGSWVWWRKFRH